MNTRGFMPALENFLHSLGDCEAVQRERLQRLVKPNESSEFGRRHGFSSIRSVADFQSAVPVCGYGDLRGAVERMLQGQPNVLTSEPVRRFFMTSGSTAAPKYIPVTPSLIRDKARVFETFWTLAREAHPDAARGSFIFNFTDTGHEQRTTGGAVCSSESSFWNAHWRVASVKNTCPLPRGIMNIAETEARYYAIARIMLETDISVLMTLNPSTMAMLSSVIHRNADRLVEDIRFGTLSQTFSVPGEARACIAARCKRNEKRAKELERAFEDGPIASVNRVWSNMKLAVCWRSPMVRPYLDLLSPFLGTTPQRDYVTMASEGVMAVPFEDEVSGGLLPIHTHFYEFIPEESAAAAAPDTLQAHELEVGQTYVVVLTTSAGLYRYNIGDVVRVRKFFGSTPVVEFLHRAGDTCSLTGEKLTQSQVAGAVRDVAEQLGLVFTAFTLSPAAQPYPHYVLSVEMEAPFNLGRLRDFLLAVDHGFGQRNIEYQSKRSSQRLGSPELCVLSPGSHSRLREQRLAAGANDAQIKLPCLIRDFDWDRQFHVLERVSCASLT
jgi:hypothetical protein